MGKDQELIQAIRNNDVALVKKILAKFKTKSKKASKKNAVHIIDLDGFAPLHHAALSGSGEIVMALLELTNDVNVKDKKGMTPLHLAAWAGKVEPALLLLDAGAQTNLCSRSGATPLHLASEHGNYVVVERLVDHDCDPTVVNNQGETALDLACRFGHLEVVRILLNNSHGKCEKLLNPKEFQEKASPLHMAAKTGHFDVVRLLVEAGADVNQKGPSGTCLHDAALYGKTEVVKYLIEAGIDVNLKNKDGLTALDVVTKFTKSGASSEIKHLLREASVEVVYAKAIKDYCNIHDGSFLTLRLGDIVLVLDRRRDNMWKGCIRDDQKERIGFFPASAVKVLRSPSRNSVVRSSTSSTDVPKVSTMATVSNSFEIVTVTPPTQPVAGTSRAPRMSSFRKKAVPKSTESPDRHNDVDKRKTMPIENGENHDNMSPRTQSENDLDERKKNLNYLDVLLVDKNPNVQRVPPSAPASKTEYADIWLPQTKGSDVTDGGRKAHVNKVNGKLSNGHAKQQKTEHHQQRQQLNQQQKSPQQGQQQIQFQQQLQQKLQHQLQQQQQQQQRHRQQQQQLGHHNQQQEYQQQQQHQQTEDEQEQQKHQSLKPVVSAKESCPPLPMKARHYTMSSLSSTSEELPPLPLKKRQSFSGRTSAHSPTEPTLPPKIEKKNRSSLRTDRRGTSPPPPPPPPPMSSSPSPVATDAPGVPTSPPAPIAKSNTLTVGAKWCPVLSPSPPPPPPPPPTENGPNSPSSLGDFPLPPPSSPPQAPSPGDVSPQHTPPSSSPQAPLLNDVSASPSLSSTSPSDVPLSPVSSSPPGHVLEDLPPPPPSLLIETPESRTGPPHPSNTPQTVSNYAVYTPKIHDKCPLESDSGAVHTPGKGSEIGEVSNENIRPPIDGRSRGGYEDMNRLKRAWTKTEVPVDQKGYVLVTPVKRPSSPAKEPPSQKSVSSPSLLYENFTPLKTKLDDQRSHSETEVSPNNGECENDLKEQSLGPAEKPEKPDRHRYVNCEVIVRRQQSAEKLTGIDIKETSQNSSEGGYLEKLGEVSSTPIPIPVPSQPKSGVENLRAREYDELYDWLAQSKLLAYMDNFAEAGFDLSSMAGLTGEDLSEIQVTKTGHRKRLLSEASRLPMPDLSSKDDVPTWLKHLGLARYCDHFMDGGFDDIEFLYDLTAEDLRAIGITKVGHQRKILMAAKRLQQRDSYDTTPSEATDVSEEKEYSEDKLESGAETTGNHESVHGLEIVPCVGEHVVPKVSHYDEIKARNLETDTSSPDDIRWAQVAGSTDKEHSPVEADTEKQGLVQVIELPKKTSQECAEKHTIIETPVEDTTAMNGTIAGEDNADGVKELAASFQHTIEQETRKAKAVPPPVKPKTYKKPPPPAVAPKPKPGKHKVGKTERNSADINSTVDFTNVIKEAEALSSESGSESPPSTLGRQHKSESGVSLDGSLQTNTSGSQGSLNSESEDFQREIKESLQTKKTHTTSVEDVNKQLEQTLSLSQEDLIEQQKREEELKNYQSEQSKTDMLFTDIQGMLDNLNSELDDMFK